MTFDEAFSSLPDVPVELNKDRLLEHEDRSEYLDDPFFNRVLQIDYLLILPTLKRLHKVLTTKGISSYNSGILQNDRSGYVQTIMLHIPAKRMEIVFSCENTIDPVLVCELFDDEHTAMLKKYEYSLDTQTLPDQLEMDVAGVIKHFLNP